jgi:hypothetical protein
MVIRSVPDSISLHLSQTECPGLTALHRAHQFQLMRHRTFLKYSCHKLSCSVGVAAAGGTEVVEGGVVGAWREAAGGVLVLAVRWRSWRRSAAVGRWGPWKGRLMSGGGEVGDVGCKSAAPTAGVDGRRPMESEGGAGPARPWRWPQERGLDTRKRTVYGRAAEHRLKGKLVHARWAGHPGV